MMPESSLRTAASNPVATDVRSILSRIQALAAQYFLHASGQALAWYTLATHDLSKWESAAVAAGTLVLTSALRRISNWIK